MGGNRVGWRAREEADGMGGKVKGGRQAGRAGGQGRGAAGKGEGQLAGEGALTPNGCHTVCGVRWRISPFVCQRARGPA